MLMYIIKIFANVLPIIHFQGFFKEQNFTNN
jgi:hypothetical protein